jgi:anti-sigma regulatory factor (Ser/Thr protein kinase)
MPANPKVDLLQARTWATKNVSAHSKDFSRAFAQRFGLTRAGAAPFVRALEKEGFVLRAGASTRPVFSPGPRRYMHLTYALPGVDESWVWEQDVAPHLNLRPNISNIAHFALTEMINNANDHSDGDQMHLIVDFDADWLLIVIQDNGIGVFKKIANALGLDDMRLVLLELAKGKFTTAPQHHSGEGIFFTSRAMDAFRLYANGYQYKYLNPREFFRPEEMLDEDLRVGRTGTTVSMAIWPNSETKLKDVFDHYTADAPDDMTFSKTVVPVRLARVGTENLISRSQAKRLLARVDQFKSVQLDFSEVPEIGQAFADEIFRVFALAHPQVQLEPINANPDVVRMIKRAQQTKVQGA